MPSYYIGLGANLKGNYTGPDALLVAAIQRLRERGEVKAVSKLYRSKAFPDLDQPDYANAALWFTGDFEPLACLSLLHEVEAAFGRVRHKRWEARLLDLDILALAHGPETQAGFSVPVQSLLPDAAAEIFPDRSAWHQAAETIIKPGSEPLPTGLILPHPRLHKRLFALLPLADITPDYRHPVLGLGVRAMIEALQKAGQAGVEIWRDCL